MEVALGLTHVDGRTLRGWRRAFADLYRAWSYDASLLDRLMDHAKPLAVGGGSTRVRVYLDKQALDVLSRMAEIVEYARSQFPRTGVPRRPDA